MCNLMQRQHSLIKLFFFFSILCGWIDCKLKYGQGNEVLVVIFSCVLLCHTCQFSRVSLCSNLVWRTHTITYFIWFIRSKIYILWMCFHLIMMGNNSGQGSYLQSQEWLQTISQAASSQRLLADNMKDITLYITTLGSHKHNKSRAKSIKHSKQMKEGGKNRGMSVKRGLTEGLRGGEETWRVNRQATLRENWYMGWILLRSFIMKYNKEARAAAGR